MRMNKIGGVVQPAGREPGLNGTVMTMNLLSMSAGTFHFGYKRLLGPGRGRCNCMSLSLTTCSQISAVARKTKDRGLAVQNKVPGCLRRSEFPAPS